MNNFPTRSLALKRAFTPLIDGVGLVYAADAEGWELPRLTRFHVDTILSWGSGFLSGEPVGFAMASDGTVFVAAPGETGTDDGGLIALPP